jgi:ABC-type sulfate/molybdate transport systems ATPase subunit
MIQARIRKTFPPWGDAPGFSLDIEFQAAGGTTVLFGPGGAGKTLLLDTVAGLLRPDEGRILLNDQILFDRGSSIDVPARRRPCGYIFPERALFPHMTLRQNLVFAASCRNLPRLERHRKVSETLERFGLTDRAARRPAEVTASDRQRCALARAVIGQPKLLLVDQPPGGLEAPLRAEFHALLREVRLEFGIPMLVATRDLEDCFELGDQMLALDGGRLLQSGSPRQVFDQPANLETARLLGCFNLLPVQIEALDPVRKTSRLRLGENELTGPYFPGRLRGDRVTLSVRHEEVLALAATGRPGPNQIAAPLVRVSEGRHSVRLHFAGRIVAELSRREFEERKHIREWVVEFPAQCLRVF